MHALLRDLLKLDAESDWTEDQAVARDGARQRLEHYLKDVLTCIDRSISGIRTSYVAIAGLAPGVFQPIASLRRQVSSIEPTPTRGGTSLTAELLKDVDPGDPTEDWQRVKLKRDPTSHPGFRGDPACRWKLIIPLIAHGEFYGFISIDSNEEDWGKPFMRQSIEETHPVLSRTIADAVFSMRLRTLARPFEHAPGEADELSKEIVKRTVEGFAADGAILRLYNPHSRALEVASQFGKVDPSVLEIGHGIADRVFRSRDRSWAISMASGRGKMDTELMGVGIPKDEDDHVKRYGIYSYFVMRLTAEVAPPQHGELGLGTLAFLHFRPHRFSWRDHALFKAYCQRVADTISLGITTDFLVETAQKLRMRNEQITRVEILALLGHDLGHKAFNAVRVVEDYIDRCRKSMNNRREQRTHEHLDEYAQKARDSVKQMENAIIQIRHLYQGDREDMDKEEWFEVSEVIAEVRTTLAGALERSHIEFDVVCPPNIRLHGLKNVLVQVLFNLVINSIEATKTQRRQRGGAIHVRVQIERQGSVSRVVITFKDEGPGINRQLFPDPNKIFELGTTSKPHGTGTGLAVSRSLLGTFFKAHLTLENPETALFKITFPASS